MILLVKEPVPDPSVVLLSLVVGLADVLQQTPLAVMKAPSSTEIFPPLVAVVVVMEEGVVVESVGVTELVVNVRSLPYAIPAELVAYARRWYSVPGLNPVMLLVKLPVPVPSVVLLSLVVGLVDVLQQTPLAVTEVPPSEVTFPPLEALVGVIEDIGVVVTMGNGDGYS